VNSAQNPAYDPGLEVRFAAACFSFLPTRAKLDLAGWSEEDIFAHS
jgi:hypothetical protein